MKRRIVTHTFHIQIQENGDILHLDLCVRLYKGAYTAMSRSITYYWYSALGPVWAETRVQSGDWYGSGTLHPG